MVNALMCAAIASFVLLASGGDSTSFPTNVPGRRAQEMGTPTTGDPNGPRCGWEGHCAGDSCSTFDDCADQLVCNSGTCGYGGDGGGGDWTRVPRRLREP